MGMDAGIKVWEVILDIRTFAPMLVSKNVINTTPMVGLVRNQPSRKTSLRANRIKNVPASYSRNGYYLLLSYTCLVFSVSQFKFPFT